MATIENLFRAPYSVPNGLQVTEAGLWIVDQITDRVMLTELEPINYYNVPKMIREIPSESSNTSGLTVDNEGAVWLAANGAAGLFRRERPADAKQGFGDILKIDPETGDTLARHPLPGGGGTHGLEFDRFEAGMMWLTTLKDQTLTKVRIEDWSVQQVIPLPYKRAHGVVRVVDGIWVAHTGDRVIVKLNLADGAELDRIEVPEPHPEPHGLAIFGNDLLYCDAASGWVAKITL